MNERPILLGGYAAKSCARKTHDTYDATIAKPPEMATTADLQQLFDLAHQHEEAVFDLWLSTGQDVVDLRHLDEDKQGHIGVTVRVMTDRRAVILGGRLPDDAAGGRTGKPDVLLRVPDGGHHAGDVKATRS